MTIIRRELAGDAEAIRDVTAAAFLAAAQSAPPTEPGGPPGEVELIDRLRAGEGWIPELSLVAEVEGEIIGHVVGSRAYVGSTPVVGLGPLSVVPTLQGHGIGSALMHSVLGAAGALGEPLVGLLGDPDFYRRFGFVCASTLGVVAPHEDWGGYFQVRALAAGPGLQGPFRYATAFNDV